MPEICVALLTPFTASGDVALHAVEMHVEFLIARGVTSLMPCGTTGEGMLLDAREVVDVVRCVARVASGRAGIDCTHEDRSLHAERALVFSGHKTKRAHLNGGALNGRSRAA